MDDSEDEPMVEAVRRFNASYDVQDTRPLGDGAYGKVYKAVMVTTGETVAMKRIKFDTQQKGIPSTAIREIAILKVLLHPNVLRLYDAVCKRGRLVLVFEFLENDLKKYMKSVNSRLTPDTIKSFSWQLARGCEFCHASRIIHRNLKPQNLRIDNRLRLKIADFGLARAFQTPVPKYTHEVVTVWYRPPEILLGSELYSVPVDVWSIGCILAEMATGAPLFAGDSEIDTIFKIFQKLGTPTEAQWPGLRELPDFKPTFPKWPHKGWVNIRNTHAQVGAEGISLLERLMAYNPADRISARRALQHTYFADVDTSNCT